MLLKCLVLILIMAKDATALNCELQLKHLDNRWIYAIQPTPGTWDILHMDFVQDGHSLYLICDHNNQIMLNCARGTLQSMPAGAKCDKRMKATVTEIADTNCRQLGGRMYQIRYQVHNLRLYEVCYDPSKLKVLYSHHYAYSFKSLITKYQSPLWTLDLEDPKTLAEFTGLADSFETANINATFVRLLAPDQTHITNAKAQVWDRGHLVNKQDFLSYDQKESTFQYINVMPQYKRVNRGEWRSVENWIHDLHGSSQPAEVITGTHGVLELEHSQPPHTPTPMYLMTNQKNPIPMWMYKVVKSNGICTAVVSYNYKTNTKHSCLCTQINCPDALESKLKISRDDKTKKIKELCGDTMCCNLAELVRKVGQHAALCEFVDR